MSVIPPRARLVSLVIAAAGVFIAASIPALLIALIVVIALLIRARILGIFLKFILTMLGPAAIMLVLIWGLVCRAPPGAAMGSDPRGGALYAAMIALRLAVLGGVVQLALLSVPPRLLPATLRGWGLKSEGLVVALGVFAVGPELLLRGEQVMTARKARGIAGSGTWGQVRQLPALLRPLFVWSIRSAVHRSEAWHQRALLLKVDQLQVAGNDFWPAGGAITVGLSILWLAIAIGGRFA
jgi:energy-coupling factor transporter transmembrane protein EcfT